MSESVTSNPAATTGWARRRRATLVSILAAALTAAAGLSGCSSSSGSGSTSGVERSGAGAPAGTSTTSAPPAPAVIAADVAKGSRLGLAQPVTVTSPDGTIADVSVTDAKGAPVTGRYDATRRAWLPAGILGKSATYTVKVTVAHDGGQRSTNSRALTTAADGAGTTGIYTVTPFTRSNVGNAQPVVLTFSQPVPKAQRGAVAQRFTVTDTAGVEGAWRWLSPTRLDYRPKNPWPVGDTVSVKGGIQGMRIGSTWGAGTLTDTGFTVTSDLAATYDPGTHLVTVTRGDAVVRTMKSGGGKKGYETPSGAMVVLGKQESVRMTSCSTGISCTPGAPEFYDEKIDHAVQLTPSGVYLHAAAWDTKLGREDTSHGCLHLSAADAAWFYENALPGTLVTVKGRTNPVDITNGQGDWNLNWQQWKGATA